MTGSVRVGEEGTGWIGLRDLSREELITGRSDQLAITAELAALYEAAAETGEAVLYGWPLVVVPGYGRARVAGPLFITRLERAGGAAGTDGEVCRPVDDEPYLNPGLVNSSVFPAEACAAAQSYVQDGYGFGDPDAVQEAARQVVAGSGP